MRYRVPATNQSQDRSDPASQSGCSTKVTIHHVIQPYIAVLRTIYQDKAITPEQKLHGCIYYREIFATERKNISALRSHNYRVHSELQFGV